MSRLLRYEVRLFAGARLTWCVLALLLVAMVWGAFNGERHARDQRAAVERVRQHEAAALAESLAEVARYARPAPALLPYWQDPADVAGFMRYKLVAYAVKPPLALAGLASGQSRLLPFYLRTDLDYVAPPAASFDYVSPRALSLGEFDLAFVLVFVLPLALIALGAPRLAAERDSGALALMAVQLPSLRRLVALKLCAMVLVCVPFAMLAAGLAMLLAGTPWWHAAHARPLLLAALALAAYTLLWCCLCVLVASRSGVIASYLRLILLFTVSAFVLPAGAALAIELAWPAPSNLQYLDQLRRTTDISPARRDALLAGRLASVAQVPYATKMIFVQRDIERQLRPQHAAAAAQRTSAGRVAAMLRWLSPAMVFDELLQQAAGTDGGRHQRFLAQADAYTETLRGFFWPRALEDAARPVRACKGCATRLNFTAHERIPRFAPGAAQVPVRAMAAGCGYLLLLAAGLLLLAARRREGGIA